MPLCRLVEDVAPGLHENETVPRPFSYDRSLLAALVDRWRPETHTFHFPVGEMAPTLEDVNFLFGPPCAGAAVSEPDTPLSWCQDLHARFSVVPRREGACTTSSVVPTHPHLHLRTLSTKPHSVAHLCNMLIRCICTFNLWYLRYIFPFK